MSLDATRWAWQQKGLSPSEKLILLALADRCGADDTAYPSYQTLVDDTGLDRKTIWSALRRLEEAGIISDTGERRGPTKRVVVWKLNGVRSRHDAQEQSQKRNDSKNGIVPKTDRNSSENGTINGSENGTLNSSKNGTRNLPCEPTKGIYQEPERVAREKTPPPDPDADTVSLREPAPPAPPAKPKTQRNESTFRQWLDVITAKGERPVRDYQALWEYCDRVGIPSDWVAMAWEKFTDRYLHDPQYRNKRYKDWRHVFLNAIRDNWYGLWCVASDGSLALTGKGKMLVRELETSHG